MSKKVRIAIQIEAKVLKELKKFAYANNQSTSQVISVAVTEYIDRARLCPVFRRSMEDVLDEHSELLERLTK